MKRETLSAALAARVVIFDGGFGTELYRRNFFVNTSYDDLNLSNAAAVAAIHQSYVDAGAEVLTTNTYNANSFCLSQFGLAERSARINQAAVALARKAAAGRPGILVAGSIGPAAAGAGAVAAIREQIAELQKSGADFLIFESLDTLDKLRHTLTALADTACEWVPSFTLDAEAKLADGGSVTEIAALLRSSPVPPTAFGLNCGAGPETTLAAMEKAVKQLDLPFIVQPGAGAPRSVDNRMLAMTSPEYFTTYCMRYLALGARGLGGCCGITPAHIADMVRSLRPLADAERKEVPRVEIKPEDLLDPPPTAEKSPFGAKLVRGDFLKLVEMTPPRGIDLAATVEKAKLCAAAGFDAVNIPDGPRASCRISQVVAAIEIQERAGIETIVHCCARDRSLISLQSMILGCMAKNLRNILFITGDPPKLGDYPFSSGVFDVDSIGMVKLQSRLNRGVDAGGFPLGGGAQTAIVSGVGADPSAIDPEREYRRLAEKIEAGAEFIITQPAFDPERLLKFLARIRHFGVPVIAGVWPFASYRNAVFMQNEVPGVVVPEWIMDAMKNAGDKDAQRAEGIRIARSILAAIRSEVRGVATSAPFGNVNTAIAVCDGF
ncbi:MAG: bifunctional homocysteine S-methyltransferase/methylenetetrahydrofolate reductase [Lentisphaeria bacterium]|nr:bifunctional homocysteine S-methyltransferase/methylenetetrahydrofolate reductase [Lentisphaeria bacterium]